MNHIQKKDQLTPTKREIEILQYMAEGLSSKQIADRACISKWTVDNHRKNLMKKMKAKNSNELIQTYLSKFSEIKNSYL
jgi:DNA-binding CsgD family transcriptional regulator